MAEMIRYVGLSVNRYVGKSDIRLIGYPEVLEFNGLDGIAVTQDVDLRRVGSHAEAWPRIPGATKEKGSPQQNCQNNPFP
jgi:hypothetical protein